MKAIDLFAGAGGWAVAAHRLNIETLGFDFEKWAVATQQAAGFSAELADLHDLLPVRPQSQVHGLMASPSCRTFSVAGDSQGVTHTDVLIEVLERIFWASDTMGDPTWAVKPIWPHRVRELLPDAPLDSLGVLIPAAWIARTNPDWIAFEQVTRVQPIWDAYKECLEALGYHVWTGRLHSEMYGVPQARARAVLIASRHHEVGQPPATHSKFYPRRPQHLDPDVPKWVTMADALGWGMTKRPSYTVTAGGTYTGGAEPFARGARDGLRKAQEEGWWQVNDNEEPPQWPAERPSPTVVGTFSPHIVAAPGWRKAGDGPRQNAKGSVRITPEEGALLQSFPRGYPFMGPATARWRQIGNAIPPLMAEAILKEATGIGGA